MDGSFLHMIYESNSFFIAGSSLTSFKTLVSMYNPIFDKCCWQFSLFIKGRLFGNDGWFKWKRKIRVSELWW